MDPLNIETLTAFVPIVFITLALLAFAFAIKTIKDALGSTITAPKGIEDGQLLLIKVPSQNEQGPLSAEMFFSAIHGLLQEEGQDVSTFSFEIVAHSEGLAFYMYVPKKDRKFIENQVYAQYPAAEVEDADDYAIEILPDNAIVRGTEITLEKDHYYPIKTFPNYDVDPLAAITSAVTNLKGIEQTRFQVIVKPLGDTWQAEGYERVEFLRTGKKKPKPIMQSFKEDFAKNLMIFLASIITAIISGNSHMEEPKKKEKDPYAMDEVAKKEIENIKQKVSLLGFEVNIRIIGVAENEFEAQENVQSMVAALRQFSGELNTFGRTAIVIEPDELLESYMVRAQPSDKNNLFILNSEELASVYHLPHASVSTPNVEYITSRKAEPPLDIATGDDASLFIGKTNFRDRQVEFGPTEKDRRRHMYLVGKTGTGKSTFLQNMIIQDIRNGEGLCLIDPHGDLFDHVLDYVPPERVDDIVVFDPSDLQYPVAMNMFELIDPDQTALVASSIIEVFRKRFEFSWGPRMEHLLRNTFMTFLEIPNSTLLGVTRILIDRSYRRYIVNLVEDASLKDFWINEYEQIASNDRMAAEAVAPIQNRLGPFLSNPVIRNIMGQAKGTLDLADVMNSRKVLLVNLSKGKLGEDNAAILGSFLVSRLWFSALTRSQIAEDDRQDFHVYIDEFQNFATSTFAAILSESRKYRLNMVLAHQYMAQLESDGTSAVRDAVFGNVGTLMCYVLGEEDAQVMSKEFEPVFDATDVMNLGKYHLYLKMSINNQMSKPFSMVALPPIEGPNGLKDEVIAASRRQYGRPRDKVESAISGWIEKTFAPGMDDEIVARQKVERFE